MKLIGGLDDLAQKRALKRWDRIARSAGALDLMSLRQLRMQAADLRHRLDDVIHIADRRLAEPSGTASETPAPRHSDWVWRPEGWSRALTPRGIAAAPSGMPMGHEIKLFHDCHRSEITLRQDANTGIARSAPCALVLDVLGFEGSFLSLAMDLPEAAAREVRTSHIFQIDLNVAVDHPIEIFARLNVKHGPNIETIVREFDMRFSPTLAEFDLAYTEIDADRVEKIWLDLIFEKPAMNRVALQDLVVSRRWRAEI